MNKTKPYIAVGAILGLLISAILCGWGAWRYARAWLNSPTSGNSGDASAMLVPVPVVTPGSPAEPAVPHGARFLGTWTGHWDNTFAAILKVSPGNGKNFAVDYQWENVVGQPMSKKELHPFAADNVIHMPRAGITMTLSNMLPNTAKAVVDFKDDNGVAYHRTATFVRGGEATQVKWLNDASTVAPGDPIFFNIKAIIDGSDDLYLSRAGAVWTHKAFDWPTDISINGIAWDAHTLPILNDSGLTDADFSMAKIISRSGRTPVTLESTGDGITISFDDTPAGSAPYEIKISVPRKISAAHAIP